MACGTGKTLVGYEVAQRLKAKRLLTLVPSLLLVNQMIREYRARGAKHIMSVCSDESAGGQDAIQISVKELEADNTTDAKVARAFLDGPGQRIVVCTYQSLRSLSEVFDKLAFDLAIFDEAHKTAGRKSKLFAHGLTDDSVKCARRMFMTATPRHATLKESGEESQVFAMNDPKVYGPVLYSLPLRTAIEANIIDDYRIIVAVVSQKKTEDLKEQAIRVAIDRAMQVYGIRKVFTFHARVADASNFILGATDTLKGARLYHVNGNQSSAERGLKLEGFRAAEAALMTNARCLTEGVDLPAADMVAFLSPKKNPIDIVQAVGRVLRKHHSKAKGGYVFLPVFVRDGADEEAAIAESYWSGCYEVLQAMREQDEPLSVKLSKCARGDGELPEKIIVMDGRKRGGEESEIDRTEFSEGMRRAIRVKVVKPFAYNSSGKMLELLQLARSGEPRPSSSSPNPSERSLGTMLSCYTSPRRKLYKPVFSKEIRMIAPQWFAGPKCLALQDKLIAMAQRGEERPRWGSSLARCLAQYACRRSAYPDFSLRIHALSPQWFRKDVVAAMKAKLLAMAESGQPKPSRQTVEGKRLATYLCKPHPCYDSKLRSQIALVAPDWVTGRTAEDTKRKLLRLAERGEARPRSNSPMGTAIHRYAKRGSEMDQELHRLAPHWFRTPATKETP